MVISLSLENNLENMFKEIAASLELGYKKTRAPGGSVYNIFYKKKFLVRLSYFVERGGNINIIVNFGSMDQPPLSWGSYKKEELEDKAKRTIIVKLANLIKKK